MKQIFIIISAIVFFLGSVGYYLAFTVADLDLKNEMAEQIQHSASTLNIIQLSFSNSELNTEIHFTNKSKTEFIYKGTHYDLVRSVSSENKTTYFCIADKKETALFSQFKKQVNDDSPSNSAGKIQLKQVDWIFISINQNIILRAAVLIPQNFLPQFSATVIEISSPPPRA